MTGGRIDVHHHFVPAGYQARLQAVAPQVLRGMTFPTWSAESAIELMDANGIAAAVISIPIWGMVIEDAAAAKENARWCNESAAAVVGANPDRFGAFASLPVLDSDAALAELTYALDTLALDGVALPASAGPHYLGAPHWEPLFAELDRRAAVVHVHPGTPPDSAGLTPAIPDPIVEFVFDTTRAIANLVATGALERFPNIRFIFSHAGGTVPFIAGRLAMMQMQPHIRERAPKPVAEYLAALRYDVALASNPAALSTLMTLVGPSQVLFGTDWPFAPKAMAAATAAGVDGFPGWDGAARDLVNRRNALALFPRFA